MDDKRLTERESLELITSMIRRTKERYIGDGNIMLMWGYLTSIVSLAVWLMIWLTHNPSWNWLWFLIWIIGGIATPVMARREKARSGVKSYSDRISSMIWTAVGFTAIFCTLCCLAFQMIGSISTWSMMFAFALIIVPFAEIAQGLVIKENSLVAGGGVGLAIGIITVCCIAGRVTIYASWYMPLFIIAFVAMMIVPGHILNYKAKHQ